MIYCKKKTAIAPTGRDNSGFQGLSHSSPLFADAGRLAFQVTQVIKTSPTYFALAQVLDLFNIGRMQREDALHPDAIRNFAHSESLTDPTAVPLQDDALEHLGSFFVAFHNFMMHCNCIARAEIRQIIPQLGGRQSLEPVHG
jgi:hypothetical protein